MSDSAGKVPDIEIKKSDKEKRLLKSRNMSDKNVKPKVQLPKKWQKFDDLLLIPAGVKIIDNLADLADKYQGQGH